MTSIRLPNYSFYRNLIKVINTRNGYRNTDEILINIPGYCYLDCSAICFLAGWSLLQKREGVSVSFEGAPRVQQYLSRMDLFKNIGLKDPFKIIRKTEVGRFITLKPILTPNDVHPVVDEICDFLIHNFENSREIIPAFEWVVNETIDNIVNHSNTVVPGFVCAQLRQDKQKVEIGIFDFGRGVKNSLQESYQLRDDTQALSEAVKRGVTRNVDIGQGNGLAGAREILMKNQGTFCLWSGLAEYRIENGVEIGSSVYNNTPGTGILLSLDCSKPVDLSETFIGDNSWDYIASECEKALENGGIKVSDECHSFALRDTARRFRWKINALLPDMEGPLILDFSDIERTTSSFLDELLGRLMQEIGVEEFTSKIKIVNANYRIMDMANVVIRQRLHGLEPQGVIQRIANWMKGTG